MLSCLKLPLTFNPRDLEADLNQILSDQWVKHFNGGDYEGEWSGVAWRAVDANSKQIYTDPGKEELIADTPVLARCPSVRRLLVELKCPVKSVRLLKLAPGSRILEHRDHELSLEEGRVRLHIPITTSPLVDFYLNGERIIMEPGECWFINASLPHKVDNRSNADRVHLVIDCLVDDWFRSLMESASKAIGSPVDSPASNEPRPSCPEALEEFSNLVFQNVSLQERLRQVMDEGLFLAMVVRFGEEHGFIFNEQDVSGALGANRRAWIEKWI